MIDVQTLYDTPKPDLFKRLCLLRKEAVQFRRDHQSVLDDLLKENTAEQETIRTLLGYPS